VNKADRGTVFHAAEGSRKGGRKKKYVSVSVFGLGSLEKLSDGKRAIEPKRLSDFPPAIKLSKLNELLGISRASVYRMVKQGLKTYRPTGPNGDQHVRREALEAFLQDRQQFMATHRR
jgi:hypothetical protein